MLGLLAVSLDLGRQAGESDISRTSVCGVK
jgi:hypothetical protein